MNLFSTDTRQKIPVNRYWELYDTYSDGSLQLAPELNKKQMQSRLEMLTHAQEQFGFAFDAEKIWLEDVIDSSVFENYPDWLLRNINKYLLDEPLLWGVSEESDVWYASIDNVESKGFSFATSCDDEIANFSTWFGFSVYGSRNRPSAIHLVQAFKQLFNIPYHVLAVKHRLIAQPTEYNFIGIENVSKDAPEHWLLSLSNHYGSWEGIDFISRQDQPNLVEPNPVTTVFENNRFVDWQPRADGKYSHIPPRLVYKYREHIDSKDLSKHLDRYGKYAYLCQSVTCQCGETSQFYFQFKWGQLNNYIEYHIGSEIVWDESTLGYQELETVYVLASADMHCLNCTQVPNETLILIKNNRIHSLVPEVLEKIKYKFQGPFISDKLTAWDQFQALWIKNQWNRMKKTIGIKEFDGCELPDLTAWQTDSVWSENHQYLQLLSKFRHSIDFDLFKRCIQQRPVNMHGSVDEKNLLKSQWKSCAILHVSHNDEIKLVKFYWGSLLNFPEYKMGDTIRWSDYSTGDENIEELVYARGFVDGDHSIKTIIEIKHNKIVNFYFDYDKPEIDNLSYNDSAHAFYGEQWLPWLVMPDNLFIASRRPQKLSNV